MQGFLELLIATFEKKEDDPSSFQLTTHLQSYNQIKLLAIYIYLVIAVLKVCCFLCASSLRKTEAQYLSDTSLLISFVHLNTQFLFWGMRSKYFGGVV